LNEKEGQKGAIPMYRATKWTMLENSIASIPADIDCGAGRSLDLEGDQTQISTPPNERGISTNTEKIMTPEEIAAAAAAECNARGTRSGCRYPLDGASRATHDEIVAFAEFSVKAISPAR
jgi:hypothetical protein